MTAYTWSISLCFLLSLTFASALIDIIDGKIKVTIGTTAGCGDTVWFISGPFAETYEEYKDFLEVEFVPWGKTIRNADGSLSCQFLEPDCWANRLHRCALNLLNGNQEAQVHYMRCEFSTSLRPGFQQYSYLCAQAAGANLVELDYCVNTSGGVLDAAAEAIGAAQMDVIYFVPSLVINDIVDTEVHLHAWSRFKSLICFALAEDPTTGVTNCTIV